MGSRKRKANARVIGPGALSLLTFAVLLLWGTAHRLLIIGATPGDFALYQLVHGAIGTGYEVMQAAVVALLVFGVALASGRLAWTVALLLVGGLLLFAHVDQEYVGIFGTHLPYASLEYLDDAKYLASSIWGTLANWRFAVMVLLPLALFVWLGRRLRAPAGARRGGAWRGGTWRRAALGLTGWFLLALVANTASNSYVGKHLQNPVQFTPLQYFVFTKGQDEQPPVALSPALRARWDYREPFYPFWQAPDWHGCAAPGPALRALCDGLAGLAQPPNVVLIMLESFRAAESGAYGARESVTPRFDALAEHGILVRHFFANSFQTRHGIVATYCSVYPNDGPSLMQHYPRTHLLCLPAALGERGYDTLWLHNGDAGFDGMRTFFRQNGFARIIERWDYPAGTETLGWGLSDEALMERAAAELPRLREPFMVGMLSLTNHHPFEVPERFRSRQDDGVYGRFRDSMRYTDYALGRFFDLIRDQPFYGRTLFVITADTSINFPPPDDTGDGAARIMAKYQIPLLILPGFAEVPATLDTVGSQVDLAPSLMDLLGSGGAVPWAGQSLGGPAQDGFALFYKPGGSHHLVTATGLYSRAAGHQPWQAAAAGASVPRTLTQRGDDLLTLTAWALQHDHFVPGTAAPAVRSARNAPGAAP